VKPENDTESSEVDKFRALAREAVRFHFGAFPKRTVYLPTGLTNFVFSFINSDGEFVIRISPDPARMNSFIKEQWTENAAREVGVPSPQILEVGLEPIKFPYMISQSVPGKEATHHPRRLEILFEMGQYAAKINSIRTKGFGETFDWSENKLSFNSTFKEYLYQEFGFREKLEILEKSGMISRSQSKKLSGIFSEAAGKYSKPVLNHGDIRLKNVIVSEEGKINAIIDWEGCTSNIAPAWELSLALHDLGVDGMQQFLEGYGLSEKKYRDLLPLIKAFNIANYARAVEQAAAAKDKKMLAHYRLRLGGAFDLYSL
jgi:aminoglycoside phosphotransferase (APT) family kinase protein